MPSQTRSRVLCVDDDADACEMLTVLLHAYGIDATCASSAAAAWPLIKARRFDLYLLDGWLPGVDGFEFCRQLRKAHPTTPILFYSGAAYETDKQNGIAAGASGYVVKPDVYSLIDTIVQLIENASKKSSPARRFGEERRAPADSYAHQGLSFETASD